MIVSDDGIAAVVQTSSTCKCNFNHMSVPHSFLCPSVTRGM